MNTLTLSLLEKTIESAIQSQKLFPTADIAYGLIRVFYQFLGFYEWILTLRVILYWFPNFNPYAFPFSMVTYLALPFLQLFTQLIPSIFGIDLSLYLGFFCLEAVKKTLENLLMNYYP